jgi:hypothetical protein
VGRRASCGPRRRTPARFGRRPSASPARDSAGRAFQSESQARPARPDPPHARTAALNPPRLSARGRTRGPTTPWRPAPTGPGPKWGLGPHARGTQEGAPREPRSGSRSRTGPRSGASSPPPGIDSESAAGARQRSVGSAGPGRGDASAHLTGRPQTDHAPSRPDSRPMPPPSPRRHCAPPRPAGGAVRRLGRPVGTGGEPA